MNSYGSVSRVSESIYKLLRYMNWISSNNDDVNKVNDDADDDDNDDTNHGDDNGLDFSKP